jgi:hypothetical protein
MAESSSKKRKRKYKHEAKEDHESLQYWADGARQDILELELKVYTEALERGWDYERVKLQCICNKFHYYIPWNLPDHLEPEPKAEPYNPDKHHDSDNDLDAAQLKKKQSALNKMQAVSNIYFIQQLLIG